ncbi:hypothetical protein D3C74_454500 [compost metagenome]
MILINGQSNILIDGTGTIDGNRVNQTFIDPIAGIYVLNSYHITILNVTVKECYNFYGAVYDSEITNSTFKNSGIDGIVV